jgi:hypothetical protein
MYLSGHISHKIFFRMVRLPFLFVLCTLLKPASAQYNWKLEKQKDGISVYLSDVPGSNFKAVKTECTLTGTYIKLVALLTNVSRFPDWIYHCKTSTLLQQKNPLDFIYYSETSMPWPVSNRDVIIHMRIRTDSLPRFLVISGKGEPDFLPRIISKVRVPHYEANWKVTMPTPKTIPISYIIEIDPGGSIPAWAANSFIVDGPYGTMKNLGELLMK